ncbi:SRPBCC family protein [Rhizobium brockwellii]|uniref:SRPBCC family protein n=1 Tax=Rhizobium brockwellii TaxID=3019932 RepID=UPI003F982880
MAIASATLELPIPADVVWNLIGGFGSLPDWLPYIPHSELSEGGRIRTLANPNGDAIVERLIAFDHVGRSYSYAILRAPFPVVDYHSTLHVLESEAGSRVVWSGVFTPAGSSDADAIALFEGIYTEGLRSLASKMEEN